MQFSLFANFEGFHWNNSFSANLLSMKRVLGKASRLDYSADKECYNLTKGDNSMSIKAKKKHFLKFEVYAG